MLAVVGQERGDLCGFRDGIIRSELGECKPVDPVVLQIRRVYPNILFHYSIYTFRLAIYFRVKCGG